MEASPNPLNSALGPLVGRKHKSELGLLTASGRYPAMLDLPNTYAALAPRLHAAGYPVLPLDGKAPKVPKWSEVPIKRQQVAQWMAEKPKANIGLRCDQALMVDIDIEDAAEAQRMTELILQQFPGGLIRLLFCRQLSNGVSRGTPKRKHTPKWPTGWSDGSAISKPLGIRTIRSGAQTGHLKRPAIGSGN